MARWRKRKSWWSQIRLQSSLSQFSTVQIKSPGKLRAFFYSDRLDVPGPGAGIVPALKPYVFEYLLERKPSERFRRFA